MKDVNMHGDHVASCLCCTRLNMGYEGDYSEQTPGRGWYCECIAFVFFDMPPDEVYKLHDIGPTCDAFVPRQVQP